MKYVTKSVRWSASLEDDAMDATIAVFEAEPFPEYTGLLDQHGNPIYRVPDPKVYGFGR